MILTLQGDGVLAWSVGGEDYFSIPLRHDVEPSLIGFPLLSEWVDTDE
jgi:hypothetical protein